LNSTSYGWGNHRGLKGDFEHLSPAQQDVTFNEMVKRVEDILEGVDPDHPAPVEPLQPTQAAVKTGQLEGFNPPAVPEKFNTLKDLIDYREKYRDAEIKFYRSLGLSEKDALKFFRAGDARSHVDASGLEENLTPEAKARLERFEQGEGGPVYIWDKMFDPSRLLEETNKPTLSAGIVHAISKDGLQPGIDDHFIYAVAALRQLKDSGGTWSDVAKALDKFTTENSGSQDDKAFLFKKMGGDIMKLAESQGITMTGGELGGKITGQLPTKALEDDFSKGPNIIPPKPLPENLSLFKDFFEPGRVFGPEKLAKENLTRDEVVDRLDWYANKTGRDVKAMFDELKNKRMPRAALMSIGIRVDPDPIMDRKEFVKRFPQSETPEEKRERLGEPRPQLSPEQIEEHVIREALRIRQYVLRVKREGAFPHSNESITEKDMAKLDADLSAADKVIAAYKAKYPQVRDVTKWLAGAQGGMKGDKPAPKQPPKEDIKFMPGDKVVLTENGETIHGVVRQAAGRFWVDAFKDGAMQTSLLREANWQHQPTGGGSKNQTPVKVESADDVKQEMVKRSKLKSGGALAKLLPNMIPEKLMNRFVAVINQMNQDISIGADPDQVKFTTDTIYFNLIEAAKAQAKVDLDYKTGNIADAKQWMVGLDNWVSQLEQQQQTGPTDRPEPGSGPTLGITPQPPKFLVNFIEQDVAPFIGRGKDAAVAAKNIFTYLFTPTSGAVPRDVDTLFKAKGAKEKFMTRASAALEGSRNMMAKLPRDQQIAFVDRVKRGLPQPTPEMQQLADLLRYWDDKLYAEAQKYKPSLNYLDNHYRVLWKVIPGTAGKTGTVLEQLMSKRPWRGSRGFLLQHTLADMSEGIAKGGVPVSYNPVDMFLLHAQDVMKFVAANQAWEKYKEDGTAVWVKNGAEPPPNTMRIEDSIAKPYFRTDEGLLAKSGEWWVQEGAAHMLNNYLSRDFVRQGMFGPIGRGLMDLKNASTAIELGLSPFHAVFETNEAVGSAMGRAITRAFARQFGAAAKEFAQALPGAIPLVGGFIPHTASTEALGLGGKMVAFAKSPEDFKARYPDAYKALTKQFPDFEQMVDDLFSGGGQVAMHDDYHIQAAKGFQEAIANDNYVGAIVRTIPAISQQMLRPIFDIYIPRLKLGTWLKDYAFELEQQSDDLAAGKTTREKIARETWAFVEDRFGELNWDNLYWNRTFKSGMQLAFRSVTWKLGNIRGFGKAGRDSLLLAYDTFNYGTGKSEKRPRITLPMGWAFSMAVLTAIQATIISKGLTGKYPWELARDTKDFILNMSFPRTDRNDPSQRVSIPTYWKDLMHAANNPVNYITSSLSGELGRLVEDWNNRDFYGTQIYNPDDPIYRKAKDLLEHLIPVPFSVGSFMSTRQSGASIAKSASGFLGYTKAPYYVSHTQAERLADELIRNQLPIGSRTREQYNRTIQEKQVVQAVKHGTMTLDRALAQGMITEQRYRDLYRQVQTTTLQHQVSHINDVNSLMKVWQIATPSEKAEIKDIMEKKLFDSKTLDSDVRQRYMDTLENDKAH